LRIWRGKHRDDFSDHDLAMVEFIRPAFTAALARARAAAGMSTQSAPQATLISEDVLVKRCAGAVSGGSIA
jgi:hypothetical protein